MQWWIYYSLTDKTVREREVHTRYATANSLTDWLCSYVSRNNVQYNYYSPWQQQRFCLFVQRTVILLCLRPLIAADRSTTTTPLGKGEGVRQELLVFLLWKCYNRTATTDYYEISLGVCRLTARLVAGWLRQLQCGAYLVVVWWM